MRCGGPRPPPTWWHQHPKGPLKLPPPHTSAPLATSISCRNSLHNHMPLPLRSAITFLLHIRAPSAALTTHSTAPHTQPLRPQMSSSPYTTHLNTTEGLEACNDWESPSARRIASAFTLTHYLACIPNPTPLHVPPHPRPPSAYEIAAARSSRVRDHPGDLQDAAPPPDPSTVHARPVPSVRPEPHAASRLTASEAAICV